MRFNDSTSFQIIQICPCLLAFDCMSWFPFFSFEGHASLRLRCLRQDILRSAFQVWRSSMSQRQPQQGIQKHVTCKPSRRRINCQHEPREHWQVKLDNKTAWSERYLRQRCFFCKYIVSLVIGFLLVHFCGAKIAADSCNLAGPPCDCLPSLWRGNPLGEWQRRALALRKSRCQWRLYPKAGEKRETPVSSERLPREAHFLDPLTWNVQWRGFPLQLFAKKIAIKPDMSILYIYFFINIFSMFKQLNEQCLDWGILANAAVVWRCVSSIALRTNMSASKVAVAALVPLQLTLFFSFWKISFGKMTKCKKMQKIVVLSSFSLSFAFQNFNRPKSSSGSSFIQQIQRLVKWENANASKANANAMR